MSQVAVYDSGKQCKTNCTIAGVAQAQGNCLMMSWWGWSKQTKP